MKYCHFRCDKCGGRFKQEKTFFLPEILDPPPDECPHCGSIHFHRISENEYYGVENRDKDEEE